MDVVVRIIESVMHDLQRVRTNVLLHNHLKISVHMKVAISYKIVLMGALLAQSKPVSLTESTSEISSYSLSLLLAFALSLGKAQAQATATM